MTMSVPLSSLPLDFAAPDDGGRLRVSMAAAALPAGARRRLIRLLRSTNRRSRPIR